jgi:hypothetical protein
MTGGIAGAPVATTGWAGSVWPGIRKAERKKKTMWIQAFI